MSKRDDAPRPRAEQPDPRAELQARMAEIERLKQFEASTTFDGDQREAFDELSVVDQHPADIADQTYQRELDASIVDLLDQEAQQVKEALARQAQGAYGVCARCGAPIDPERLAARPEATLCIACQRELESQR